MRFRTTLFLMGSVLISGTALAQSECEFNQWESYKDNKLLLNSNASAYLFSSSHVAIDADGAPNAYHPDNIGLDFLANAGYPNKNYWKDVLVVDPENPGEAYVQTSGEFAGYFVCKTSLQDKSKKTTDPMRYVDSRNVPYLVFPGSFYKKKGTGMLGDLGFAINLSTGEKSSFVVADIGPFNADMGEMSIALAERLGGKNVNPKNGAGSPQGKMLYIIFPYSSRNHAWPLSVDEIDRYANKLLEEAGGIQSVLACKEAL